MQNPKKNERTRLMREKIAELSKIDSNAHITKEELQEKKKRFSMERRSLIPNRSQNKADYSQTSQQREGSKATNFIKKVFALDSNYYKNISHIYERDSSKKSSLRGKESPSLQSSRQVVEWASQQQNIEIPKNESKSDPSSNFFKLPPVNQKSNEQPCLPTKSEQRKLEIIQPIKQVEKAAQNFDEQATSKPQFFNLTEVSKYKQTPHPLEERLNETIPAINTSNQPRETSLFGQSTISPSPLFGSSKSVSLFGADVKKDQSSQQKPLVLFSIPQKPIKLSQQSTPNLFNNSSIPKTPTSDLQKDEAAKHPPVQVKPLFSFPLKSQGIKVETQHIESTQKPQSKKFISQLLNNQDGEKKQGAITSIFETEASHRSTLNLNPAKPSFTPISTGGLFSIKAKEENSQKVQNKNLPSKPLFENPKSNFTSNKATSITIDNKTKVELSQEGLFIQNQSKTIVSSIFSAPTNPEKTSVPFFGSLGSSGPAPSSSKTQPNEKKSNFFSNHSQPINSVTKIQSSPSADGIPTNQNSNLFQKKPASLNSQINVSIKDSPQSLFSANPSATAAKTSPQIITPVFPAKSNDIPQIPVERQELDHKESDKSKRDKSTFTAIGPGGKKIQIQPLFQTESNKRNFLSINNNTNEASNFLKQPANTNLFQASAANLFTGPSTNANLFQTPSTTKSLFQTKTDNLFNLNQSVSNSNTVNLFTQQSNSIFGNAGPSLFSSQPNAQIENDEGQQDEDDGPIEAQDDANPNLSSGKYDYIQTQVFFKENANKFREGFKQTMENIVVSIEKFQGSEHRFLYIRMPNKRIAYCGKIIKSLTECRVLNNRSKNIEIKKIMLSRDDVSHIELSVVKIQFKEESVGEKFIKQINQAIGNTK